MGTYDGALRPKVTNDPSMHIKFDNPLSQIDIIEASEEALRNLLNLIWEKLSEALTGTAGTISTIASWATGILGRIAEAIANFLNLGNAVAGFFGGAGQPTSGGPLDPIMDWVNSALTVFTRNTDQTSETADVAQGVGGNALTNTVSIQAQVQGLVERQDAGWSARPLWAGMDYTGDATFPLSDLDAHVHDYGSLSVAVASHSHQPPNYTTANENIGSHSHTVSGSNTNSYNYGSHNHVINYTAGYAGNTSSVAPSASVSGQVASANIAPVALTASQSYFGYIRCGSTQDKRLFNFLAYSSGTVSTLNLDVYRMAPDGGLTLAYSSPNFAGALTSALAWVQHVIPSGTNSVSVVGGDIIAIQLRMTGSGTVYVGGKLTPVPLNPPGWLPRRISAVRNPSSSGAPSTIDAATANAQHTSSAIPFIEAAIDTGMANAPLTITDNFDGSLSQLWNMTGVNTLGITSNRFGIVQGGSDGYSWGKFQQQVRSDQCRVGFTTISPSADEQIVWFKGNGPDNHVGLAITSSYATLFTMSGGSRTNRLQVAVGSTAADWEVRFTASTWKFEVFRNGASIGSWTDTGHVTPRGLGYRFGGIALGASRSGWFGINYSQASPIDNWVLADIAS